MSKVLVKYKKNESSKTIHVPLYRIVAFMFILMGILVIIYVNAPILFNYVELYRMRGVGDEESSFAFAVNTYNPELSYIDNIFIDIEDYYKDTSFVKGGGLVDTSYNKEMYIDIPAVGIENILITSNVESFDKKEYDKYLYKGVAHFKYTPLPGDGGNSFIYGHSGDSRYFNRNTKNPHIIFTRLKDIKIGDSVYIQRDNVSIEYRVIMEKIVDTDDISILEGIKGKETVTLMTCYPWGFGTHRYVAIAEKI